MKKNVYVNTPDGVFSTYDMGLAVALLATKYELISLDRSTPRKVLFVFKREEGIEETAENYWSDTLSVQARTFFDTQKMLKNRMYSE